MVRAWDFRRLALVWADGGDCQIGLRCLTGGEGGLLVGDDQGEKDLTRRREAAVLGCRSTTPKKHKQRASRDPNECKAT